MGRGGKGWEGGFPLPLWARRHPPAARTPATAPAIGSWRGGAASDEGRREGSSRALLSRTPVNGHSLNTDVGFGHPPSPRPVPGREGDPTGAGWDAQPPRSPIPAVPRRYARVFPTVGRLLAAIPVASLAADIPAAAAAGGGSWTDKTGGGVGQRHRHAAATVEEHPRSLPAAATRVWPTVVDSRCPPSGRAAEGGNRGAAKAGARCESPLQSTLGNRRCVAPGRSAVWCGKGCLDRNRFSATDVGAARACPNSSLFSLSKAPSQAVYVDSIS